MPRSAGTPKTGGRRKGSRNKASLKREAEIAASGLTPLDFMLSLLRDEKREIEDRKWAAQHAAPYVHPKLQAVQHTGVDGEPIQFVIYGTGKSESEEDWAEEFAPGVEATARPTNGTA